MVKVLIEKILDRKKKTGIIFISSHLGLKPYPGHLTYSASKSYVNFLSQGLNYELKEKVDVLSYACGVVGNKVLGVKP